MVFFSEVACRRSPVPAYIPSADADVCANSLPRRTYLRKTATFLCRDCNITIASGTPERIACVMWPLRRLSAADLPGDALVRELGDTIRFTEPEVPFNVTVCGEPATLSVIVKETS